MQTFFDAMHEKFLLRAKGPCNLRMCIRGEVLGYDNEKQKRVMKPCPNCNGTGINDRSMTPWKEYSWDFLLARTEDEWKEYMAELESYSPTHGISDAAADELLDIANFAAFLWLKWKGGDIG